MKWAVVIIFIILICVTYGIGKREGYKEGWNEGWEFGSVGSWAHWTLESLREKYGKNLKEVLWKQFTIQEKMFLCAYGSSGNKLSVEDIQEIVDIYGDSGRNQNPNDK